MNEHNKNAIFLRQNLPKKCLKLIGLALEMIYLVSRKQKWKTSVDFSREKIVTLIFHMSK